MKGKKLLTLLLTLIMVFSFAMPVLAVTNETAEPGKITISNAAVSQDYTIYKVFDVLFDTEAEGTDGNKKTSAVYYTDNEKLLALIDNADMTASVYNAWTADTNGDGKVDDDDNPEPICPFVKGAAVEGKDGAYYVSHINPNFEDPGRGWLLANLEDWKLDKNETKKAESNTVVFDDIDYGYYLIKTTNGTEVTVNSNMPQVTVIDKNTGYPSNPTKTEDKITVASGDTVTFTSTLDATNYLYRESTSINPILLYHVTDEWDNGLKFDSIQSVKVTWTNPVPVYDESGHPLYTLTVGEGDNAETTEYYMVEEVPAGSQEDAEPVPTYYLVSDGTTKCTEENESKLVAKTVNEYTLEKAERVQKTWTPDSGVNYYPVYLLNGIEYYAVTTGTEDEPVVTYYSVDTEAEYTESTSGITPVYEPGEKGTYVLDFTKGEKSFVIDVPWADYEITGNGEERMINLKEFYYGSPAKIEVIYNMTVTDAIYENKTLTSGGFKADNKVTYTYDHISSSGSESTTTGGGQTPQTTTVYSFGFSLRKVDDKSESAKVLEGAQFLLYRMTQDEDEKGNPLYILPGEKETIQYYYDTNDGIYYTVEKASKVYDGKREDLTPTENKTEDNYPIFILKGIPDVDYYFNGEKYVTVEGNTECADENVDILEKTDRKTEGEPGYDIYVLRGIPDVEYYEKEENFYSVITYPVGEVPNEYKAKLKKTGDKTTDGYDIYTLTLNIEGSEDVEYYYDSASNKYLKVEESNTELDSELISKLEKKEVPEYYQLGEQAKFYVKEDETSYPLYFYVNSSNVTTFVYEKTIKESEGENKGKNVTAYFNTSNNARVTSKDTIESLKKSIGIYYPSNVNTALDKEGTDYAITWTKVRDEATWLTADNSYDTMEVIGVTEGDYLLEEVKAPEGYKVPDKPFKITVSANIPDGKGSTGTGTTFGITAETQTSTENISVVDNSSNKSSFNTLMITNGTAPAMPTTGGAGTIALISCGAVAFMAAAVVLVTKKRLYNEGM